jgi:uncharacterized protein (DUF1499 family)
MADIDLERAPRAPRYLALLALALAAAALLLLFLSGPGTRFGLWHFRTGFSMMRWAAYLGIAAVVLSALALALGRRRALLAGGAGLALGALACVLPWSWQREARSYPPIHDVTTDLASPPPFVAVLPLREGATNPPEHPGEETAAVQREHYPDVRPLMMAMPVDSAFLLAAAAAREMPRWEVVDQSRREGRIEAVATTPWFGFRDDVVIRVTSRAGISRVDVRSKSRVGRGDAGANAARVRAYLERLRAKDPTPVRAEE